MGRTRLLLTLALVAPGLARAQAGFDAHGLYVAPMEGEWRDLVTVQRPDHLVLGDWYAGGLLEILQDAPRLGGAPEIDAQIALNAAAGVVVNERARLDVAAPIFLSTIGPDTPGDAILGDVRVSSQLVLLQPDVTPAGGFGFGAVPWVTLPSGPEDRGLGQEGLAGGVLVNATYEWVDLTLSGQAGIGFQPEERFAGQDHAEAGVGLTYKLLERTALGLEGRAYARLVDEVQDAGLPTEVLLSVRQVSRRGPHVLAGAALGVAEGIGVPDWRVFFGGGYGRAQDPDPDGDFLVGALELCPDLPETPNGYSDLDGCPDELATMAVVPLWPNGAPMLEADVIITSETGRVAYTDDDGPAVFPRLLPTESWAAAAKHACWAGEEEDIALREGDNIVGLEMQRGLTASLRFVVVDERDVPIEDVVVSWLGDGPDCSPIDRIELPVGLGTAEVGSARHTILVSAPGFASQVYELTVPEGFDENVRMVLTAPGVAVVDDTLEVAHPLFFEPDSFRVLPYGRPVLERIAAVVSSQPELGVVEIVPPTTPDADPYAEALAARRALAVRDALVSLGVPAARVVISGYGEDLAPTGELPWATDRRIELAVPFAEVPPVNGQELQPVAFPRPET